MGSRAEVYPVWPRPREIRLTSERIDLRKPLTLTISGEAPWLVAEAAKAVSVINRAAGTRVVVDDGRTRGRALTIATMDALSARSRIRPVHKDEGYVLHVGNDGILIAGSDARGVFYGAHTLAQVIAPPYQTEVPKKFVPALLVRDWPRFPMRGAHMYLPPRRHLDFFWRFLDFMVSMKLNLLILEIGGGMEYERHPEINRAWKKFCCEALAYDFDKPDRFPQSKRSPQHFHPMFPRIGPVALQVSRYYRKDSTHTELAGGEWLTKDEVRRIVVECTARHIEIVPEVQSLSHSYYLCCAHPEIAEAQDDPWPDTYCPSNPKTYELLFDVMDEVIDVFKPRIIHIGHDEAYTFRMCPKCKKRTGHDILAEDIIRIHDFLASRGIRTMMWGDKLMKLGRYGGVARRERDPGTGKWWIQPPTWKAVYKVPKDILICDWYWSLDPRSERNFHKHGFEEIYGNFSPLGFKNIEQRANVPFVLGAEMSSWCEVSPYEFGHNATFYQFFPGSDMLWRGKQMKREAVCTLMAQWMTPIVEQLTGQRRWLVQGRQGQSECLNIAAALRPLPETLAGRLKTGPYLTTALDTGVFAVHATKRGYLEKAIVLDRQHPRSAPIHIGRTAERIIVVQGTTMSDVFHKPTFYSYHRGPAVLVRYRVKYADGKSRVFDAIYGEDIGQLEGAWPTKAGYCFRAVPVPVARTHTFFAQEWVNPCPRIPIVSLTIALGPDATDKGEIIVPAIALVAASKPRS